MEQLVELLKQIEELAGMGVDALKKSGGSGRAEPEPHGGPKPPDEGERGGEPPRDREYPPGR